MRERTVIVGDPWDRRMIGWRIGWVVATGDLAADVSRAQICNGLVPSGFAQVGVRVALEQPADDVAAAVAEWGRRRDATLRQLEGLPVIPPAGGWSLLLDARTLGVEPGALSAELLSRGVAATPMVGWGGEVAERYLRFVFSREPVERLGVLGERVRGALAALRAHA
jgi:aspartate/methionine/tyrosine aminotransferase